MKRPKYSPMMSQYLTIKENYPDTLILFRLGDFYELFFEDAKVASRELELVLTGRDAGVDERVPMCGVPHHAVNGYIERLIKKGYKIGIVEQLEDAKFAKGIVKRDVVQIITPGTLIDTGLEEKKSNYLVALDRYDAFIILSYCDLSTGELGVMNLEVASIASELATLDTKEVVVTTRDLAYFKQQIALPQITFSIQEEVVIDLTYQHLLQTIKDVRQVHSLQRLLQYLTTTQKRTLDYLQPAKIVYSSQYLQMDFFTRNNLELTRTLRSEDRHGSLLWVLDKTKTAMGGRLLKEYLARPLANHGDIVKRQEVVAAFLEHFLLRADVVKSLQEVYDLPRLIARIGYGNANGRDLVQLANSLRILPGLIQDLQAYNDPRLQRFIERIHPLDEVVALVDRSLVDHPPYTIKEGGMIRRGYHAPFDELVDLSRGGKEWIARLEASEKEKTGIKNLKIGFNKVFGFYIEITNSFLPQVKEEFGYIRKQTLSNCERFITQELKEKEDLILSAEEKMVQLEYTLFLEIRDIIKTHTNTIQELASALAELDVLVSFAEVAAQQRYCRPFFHEDRKILIEEGRHPVIEKVLPSLRYVENDTHVDNNHFFLLITGPNMGGKSTYMRQVALMVIMAQIGSYIPAKKALLPIFDKIFTRIGASDDLVSGQSTFMVEMLEANHAIQYATQQSLIIFDEIGRGTSTFDGMALAQAIIEHLVVRVQAITLFSTHYHELTNLESQLPGLKNIHVKVHEDQDHITFLYKIGEGCVNKSYGINVARLAGLPGDLLQRAQAILHALEEKRFLHHEQPIVIKEVIKESELEAKLKQVDPLSISPLEALNLLYQWKKESK